MKLRTVLIACFAMCFCLASWCLTSSITAQDTAEESTQLSDDTSSSRRLPPFYSDLVTPGQRRAIYTIQDRYEAQLEELKRQMREVVAKRDAEIEQVLEPEQRELLTQVKEHSRLLREARAKAAARLKETLTDDETSDESSLADEAN